MKRISLILILTVNWLVSYAQFSRKAIDVTAQYGWIIAHNQELVDIADENPLGIGIRYQWMKNSRKNWEACNCFHYLGAGLVVHNFRNPAELGSAVSLYGNFEPLLHRGKRSELSLGMGIGITYLTKVYDAETNPRNTFFSSPWSFLLFVTPAYTYFPAEKWGLTVSLTYQHISNGGQKKPNRGMNYPMAGLGIRYLVFQQDFPEFEKPEFRGVWKYYIDGGMNLRDTPDGDRRPSVNLNLGSYRQVLPVIGLGGGLELSYDFSITGENGDQGAFLPAVFIANHFLFGRFDFSQHYALYLHKPEGYMEDRTFYQRYTLHYQLGEKLRIGVGMKAHGHVAELLDLRLGILF